MRCEGEEGVIRAKVYAGSMIKIAVLVVAFSAIMVGTIQSALAIKGISKIPSNMTLNIGETGSFTVNVTPDHNTSNGLISVNIDPEESGFSIEIKDEAGNTLASGDGNGTVANNSISYSSGTQKTFYVDVTNNNVVGDYGIRFLANDTTSKWTHGQIWAPLTGIPEFATVAIPVAIALIGAFFFMRRRKERA